MFDEDGIREVDILIVHQYRWNKAVSDVTYSLNCDILLTLGAHAQRGSLHLTSRMSVRLKNDTIYLTGTEGQKIRAVFSKTASFERYGVICVSQQRARPYLVFVTTQASLLVKKANEILSTMERRSRQKYLRAYAYIKSIF